MPCPGSKARRRCAVADATIRADVHGAGFRGPQKAHSVLANRHAGTRYPQPIRTRPHHARRDSSSPRLRLGQMRTFTEHAGALTTTHHGQARKVRSRIRASSAMTQSGTTKIMNPASTSHAAERARCARGCVVSPAGPARTVAGTSFTRAVSCGRSGSAGRLATGAGVAGAVCGAAMISAFTRMVAEPPSLSIVTVPSCVPAVPVSAAT
jgi:hypothetical protein